MGFFGELIKHPRNIGRLTPTSRLVARTMLAPVNFSRSSVIVELGGGTGALTKPILKKLRKSAQLFVFETNPVFAETLRRINDSRLIVIESTASDLMPELMAYGVQRVDYIISSLPMVLLPHPMIENIVNQSFSLLHPRGMFIQLHHSSLMKSAYSKVFKNVRVSVMPFSLPPAFIMYCRKTIPRAVTVVPQLPPRPMLRRYVKPRSMWRRGFF